MVYCSDTTPAVPLNNSASGYLGYKIDVSIVWEANICNKSDLTAMDSVSSVTLGLLSFTWLARQDSSTLNRNPKPIMRWVGGKKFFLPLIMKGPSGEVLSRGGSLGHLVMADPPSRSDYPGLPSSTVAHSHRASLIESTGRDGMTGWVLDNHTARPVEVRVGHRGLLQQCQTTCKWVYLGLRTTNAKRM